MKSSVLLASIVARIRRPSGKDALDAWLRVRAKVGDDGVLLEDSLLTNTFARYATKRLLAFGLSRAVAILAHVVELMYLFEIFSARPFVTSIAFHNVALLVDAFFWGALEGLRRRLRELGRSSQSAALVSRWMSLALVVATGAIVMPIGFAFASTTAPPLVSVYGIACGLRLAADVVLRTYYSGVFAHGRIHRPMWSTLIGPLLVIGVTVALWSVAGGWAFVAALLVSIMASRALLLLFTVRAYRRFRVPRPHVRFPARGASSVFGREAILGGIANLSTRVGAVVLLAAVIPSLGSVEGPDDEPVLEPFAFALHLAAPFLLLATQWVFVFYHDWIRLEREEAKALARLLDRRLVVVALVIGAIGAAGTGGLVLLFVPWNEARSTITSLTFASVGLSLWASLQLRQFSRGEHIRQAASALMLVVVVAVAWATDDMLGVVAFYASLAVGPWASVAATLLLARFSGLREGGELSSVAAFVRAASRRRGKIAIWDAIVERRPAAVARRIAAHLGDGGAVVRRRNRLVWFEDGRPTSRADWLRVAGGQMRSLVRISEDDSDIERVLVRHGLAAEPDARLEVEVLAKRHAELFPDGFVVRPGATPPKSFLALPSFVRQAIWRDAVRSLTAGRSRSGWFVSCWTTGGVPEMLFVAPPPVSPEQRARWAVVMDSVDWRLGATKPEAHANEDRRAVKPHAEERIVA